MAVRTNYLKYEPPPTLVASDATTGTRTHLVGRVLLPNNAPVVRWRAAPFQSDHRRGKRIAPRSSDLPGPERRRHRDDAPSRSPSRVHSSVCVLDGSSEGIRNLDRRITSSNTNATVAECLISVVIMYTGGATQYPRSGPVHPWAAP